jgi:hypothetical protein
MPAIFGLSYWDFSYFVEDTENFEHDMDALWRAIAPTVPRNPSAHLPSGMRMSDEAIQSEPLSKWRNTWCDVISAYSHIHENRDIFVTNNTRDFQRNSEALSHLGMKHIYTPAETLMSLAKLSRE